MDPTRTSVFSAHVGSAFASLNSLPALFSAYQNAEERRRRRWWWKKTTNFNSFLYLLACAFTAFFFFYLFFYPCAAVHVEFGKFTIGNKMAVSFFLSADIIKFHELFLENMDIVGWFSKKTPEKESKTGPWTFYFLWKCNENGKTKRTILRCRWKKLWVTARECTVMILC